MADGALSLTLGDHTSARLAEKAKALGVSTEELAVQMLDHLVDDGPLDRPATHPDDYDGPYVELEDALAAFSTELDRRLAAKGT
jgi:hypothetical protein